jgi:8-oxo-dGTP diphosphatase
MTGRPYTVPKAMADTRVHAAGGLVVRADGRIAVIHRPRYDDWSLPKGKLDPGESFEAGALREVEEETGVRGRIVAELAPTSYLDRKGRDKLVRWFRMDVDGEPVDLVPNDEVDELRWVTPAEARVLLSYEHDRTLVETVV